MSPLSHKLDLREIGFSFTAMNGTSMTPPVVTGIAARILAGATSPAGLARSPDWLKRLCERRNRRRNKGNNKEHFGERLHDDVAQPILLMGYFTSLSRLRSV
jgi:hypothetical protein